MRSLLDRYLNTQVTAARHSAGNLLRSKLGPWILGGVSFVEAALPVPLLTDPFIVAYILANPRRVWFASALATVSSVLGGLVAYFTAYYFFELLVTLLAPGLLEEVQALSEGAAGGTFLLTLIGAITPIPYTLTAWAIGLVEGSVLVFILSSCIGRGFRYALVGYATDRFGEFALARSRVYITIVSIALVAVVLGYFFLKL
jgi:membrane protein YqaA with SNARE-associated domain